MKINIEAGRKIVQELREIAAQGAKLDMGEVHIPMDLKNVCGTPACFGGWLTQCPSLKNKCITYQRKNFLIGGPGTKEAINFNKTTFTYSSGAKVFAKELGFGDVSINCYLESNPELWGNECGDGVFSSDGAYRNDEDYYNSDPISLEAVCDHWDRFFDRVEKHQEAAA